MENVSKKRFYSDWQIFQVKATWKNFLAVVIEPSKLQPKDKVVQFGCRNWSVWSVIRDRISPPRLAGRTTAIRRALWMGVAPICRRCVNYYYGTCCGRERKKSSLNGSWSNGIMALPEWKCFDQLDKNISPRVVIMKHFLDHVTRVRSLRRRRTVAKLSSEKVICGLFVQPCETHVALVSSHLLSTDSLAVYEG